MKTTKNKEVRVQVGNQLFRLVFDRTFKVEELSAIFDKYDVRMLKGGDEE